MFIGASAGNIVGPLLFRTDEAPNYSKGLRVNLSLFAVILFLVAVTTLYLRYLNRMHARRRVALGKKAKIVDMSLETAEEVERLGEVQRAMRHDAQSHNVISDTEDAERSSDQEPEPAAGNKGTSFADLTDLENEDFVFVY